MQINTPVHTIYGRVAEREREREDWHGSVGDHLVIIHICSSYMVEGFHLSDEDEYEHLEQQRHYTRIYICSPQGSE